MLKQKKNEIYNFIVFFSATTTRRRKILRGSTTRQLKHIYNSTTEDRCFFRTIGQQICSERRSSSYQRCVIKRLNRGGVQCGSGARLPNRKSISNDITQYPTNTLTSLNHRSNIQQHRSLESRNSTSPVRDVVIERPIVHSSSPHPSTLTPPQSHNSIQQSHQSLLSRRNSSTSSVDDDTLPNNNFIMSNLNFTEFLPNDPIYPPIDILESLNLDFNSIYDVYMKYWSSIRSKSWISHRIRNFYNFRIPLNNTRDLTSFISNENTFKPIFFPIEIHLELMLASECYYITRKQMKLVIFMHLITI